MEYVIVMAHHGNYIINRSHIRDEAANGANGDNLIRGTVDEYAKSFRFLRAIFNEILWINMPQ